MVTTVFTNRDSINHVTNDFWRKWNLFCRDRADEIKDRDGLNTYPFAQAGMLLLDLIRQGCAGQQEVLDRFLDQLDAIDARYNLPLPSRIGSTWTQKKYGDLTRGGCDTGLILHYDLIRNGQAHDYQQAMAVLEDGTELRHQIWGPLLSRAVEASAVQVKDVFISAERATHLSEVTGGHAGRLTICFRPEIFFADLQRALHAADILPLLVKGPLIDNRAFKFTTADLRSSLQLKAATSALTA